MLCWQSATGLVLAYFLIAPALEVPHPAFAWGDKGHEIIGLIAEHYLDPATRAKVATLLAADTETLTDHDIASEATWATNIGTATALRPGSATKQPGGGTLRISSSGNRILPQPV
jgi:S1/P1 Nuclease